MSAQKARSRAAGGKTPPQNDSFELRNYRLHRRIAQEELATVYAATHSTLDRPVHVHILRRTDWVSVSRFQLAAKLAAHLNHPNLLPVIDAGHDEQYGDYLVTPSINAQRLADILEQGPVEPVPALKILTQLAAVLDYLHENQIVHRDVQPNNILVTPEGVTYLTNLSLVASPETPDLSSVDEADYISSYSAPEQRLDQSESSPRLDVYSLGAVLYHMLWGDVPPPPGTDLPALGSRDPNLARADAVLHRMMAEMPDVRPASAGESVVALRHAMRVQIDQASEDMEESRWEPVAEWLENPLETVLGNIQKEHSESGEASDAPPQTVEALQQFQDYLGRSRARADDLHRGNAIRRYLTRWSNRGFFRRHALGQVIQLEQVISYNIHFYELRTLYETRTEPEVRQRTLQADDRRATLPLASVWEAAVPEQPPFTEVKPQQLVLPNSLNIFTCPECGGAAEIVCATCEGTGMVERTRKVRNPDGTQTEEAFSEQCPTCRSYGKVTCPRCEGNGNLVEEAIFTWSRRARLWQNTDDIEDLPGLVLQQRAQDVCTTPINLYAGYWHSVAPLDELLKAAIADVKDANTRIIAAELHIRSVPVTEITFQMREGGTQHALYIIGFENEVVGDWNLLNPERLALVGIGVVVVLALLVWLLIVLL